jgi:ABC-type Fe3+-hydroxamate transport system substrate-binding protein
MDAVHSRAEGITDGDAMKGRLLCALLCLALPALAQRVVTDETGRKVTVPEHPHRIVCLLPSAVDDLYALGAGDEIVAVTDFVKYPEVARKKPSVGLPMNPSLEAIVAAHPDLVIGGWSKKGGEDLQPLLSYGIPLYMIDPHGLQAIYSTLLGLGDVLNREAQATILVAQLRAREQAVRARAVGRPRVRVFMPVWYEPITTIGKNSFISELIETAGAKSVTDDIAQEWPQVSLEAILTRKPDVLLLVKGEKFTLHDLQNRPVWNLLDAVRNDKVIYLDDRIEFPSPIAIDALEELSKALYP